MQMNAALLSRRGIICLFKTLEYITDPNLNPMCEHFNKCINRAVVIMIIINCLFNFI